jgi:hypothetical protein
MFERLFGAIEKKERSFSGNGSGVRYLAKNTLKAIDYKRLPKPLVLRRL